MDKSFNDQELSDIMKEIEALEEDFKAEGSKESVPEASPVMEELAEMDEIVSIPTKAKPEVIPFQKKKDSNDSHKPNTCMSFKVQGDLQLDLVFEIGGKTINLGVTETGLHIQMDGGVTFTVPMHEVKKAV